MKGLALITGSLVGLAAPVLVVGATVGANVLSISRDALWATKKKVSRKATTTTYSRVGTDAAVIKMPERRPDAEVRRAA